MRSERNGKAQMDPLFPRLSINGTEKRETTRAPPRNKMAMCEESVSMPAFHHSDLKPSESQNHKKSVSCLLRLAEMQWLKSVYDFFRPLHFINPEISSLKTHGKEDNFRLPKFLQYCDNDIEDELWKEKLTSSSSSSSGKREEVNSSGFDFGTISDLYDLVNTEIQLNDFCTTSRENTALIDGICERIEKNFKRRKKRSHSGKDDVDVNRCCKRDNIDGEVGNNIDVEVGNNIDVEVGNAGGRSTSISTSASMVHCKSADSKISPREVADRIGPKLFWLLRKAIIHQQRIFTAQVFELHRVIKVQRSVAESPEIVFEEMLHSSNYSTKFSLVKELPSQTNSEATSSLMKSKVDSQRPNSRLKTTAAAQDLHQNLPFIECDTKKKGHITHRDALGPSSTTSWYVYPGYRCLIPERSHSEGFFYEHYAGLGTQSSPVYGSYGVPRLSVIDRDFTMPTSGIRPSGQHGVVEASNSSKTFSASKECDVNENVVHSRPPRTLSLFPVGSSLFQASNKEIPSNNTEMEGIQVIKVVPHNPKFAYESAARILQSILEEKQKGSEQQI